MQTDYFLDFESSSYDDDGFPLAVSWSMSNGTIKSILIMPDDRWLSGDYNMGDVDIQHYLDQGRSGIDVIREMNEDLTGQSVYIDGIDDDLLLLERICDCFDTEPDFELLQARDLFSTKEPFHEQRQTIMEEHQLDNQNSRDNVMAMLILFQQFTDT